MTLFVLALAFLALSCAAGSKPADAGRPRANNLPYPVTLASSDERRAQALAAWQTLVPGGVAHAPELQPVTATVRALPPDLAIPLQLQKATITDPNGKSRDATRESLRRFIETAAPLLGVELRDISLVEVADRPDGTRLALYTQNPFDLPLRNGFGVIEIIFSPDLRIVGLSSTAIPDTEQLRRAISAARVSLPASPETTLAPLVNQTVRVRDAAGNEATRSVNAASELGARELVIFPVRREGEAAAALELHLAWEITLGGQTQAGVFYVDAVTGEQITSTATNG